ncbi:hypothetical protein EMPS_02074 [Entomortierella parvispora]|uniref:JmjC domain-containing protein n=1 Tax=Entomortierella parvispora TaxID=205924 RepID=A0A9P3H420_9FUNG|nr:hypothetical protein EMPS_02074 [Entomortierella parvispora]
MHDLSTRFISLWSASDFVESTLGHAPLKGLKDAVAQLQVVAALQTEPTSSTEESRRHHAKLLLFQSDVLMDLAREMLHAFPYREVPACWRELYTDAGILKALALGILGSTCDKSAVSEMDDEISLLRKALRTCDQVLVMAGASGQGRKDFVFALIKTLEDRIQSTDIPSILPSKRKSTATQNEEKEKTTRVGGTGQIPRIQYPIPRIHLPTMDAFQEHINGPLGGTPLIITGAMDHWPALEKWKDPRMICRIAGPDRLVPIEIGSQYTDEQWTQKFVTMKDFVEQFVDDGDDAVAKGQVGYLAQHDVFDQIPRLRRDIDIPDYCLVAPRRQDGYQPPEDVLLNAWFGPGGTISPMHTDPYYNLLAQVVGRKYVRLYSPKDTPKLYSFATSNGIESGDEATDKDSGVNTMLGNTSQVEVEQPDLTKFPLFASAEYVEAVLEAGELLYIPLQWWHYIRSLSTSFSVSFWF